MTVNTSGSHLNTPTTHDKNQLVPSIDKLFHYTAAFTKHELNITVRDGDRLVGTFHYNPIDKVDVSPTLYTRLDGCHGAGNCCRVPFDLVYSDYDRRRVEQFDMAQAAKDFGQQSARGFADTRVQLLECLEPLQCDAGTHSFRLWVQRNTEVFKLSGRKSCPYLLMDRDRYLCGVHPFKPLHCWMPHMTIRHNAIGASIGRMQYGRNHKFGCPVRFAEAHGGLVDDIFDDAIAAKSYFDSQFESDIAKLKWIDDCTGSMGFDAEQNAAIGLFGVLRAKSPEIRQQFRGKNRGNINLWSRDD